MWGALTQIGSCLPPPGLLLHLDKASYRKIDNGEIVKMWRWTGSVSSHVGKKFAAEGMHEYPPSLPECSEYPSKPIYTLIARGFSAYARVSGGLRFGFVGAYVDQRDSA
ncbi:hypothetical protein NL676_012709 [Syzygium grande]|nr:hypothetical protein NL676_012709 [Syzygium grande]